MDRRDPALSRTARAADCSDHPGARSPAEPGPVAAAVALRAVLPPTTARTTPERGLLSEWPARVTDPT